MLKTLASFIMLLGGLMTVTAAEIDAKWLQAYQDKGASYQPRTSHFKENGQPTYINRLILEDSPYLNQHAHNPVNWYPWGLEAFEAAKQQDKPIFLSIGYSTCHWCHVMEEESFDNVEIAKLMNDSYINIKVDREQRPEIDELYMTAVQLMTGHGGWPMSSFLTPQGKTFWAGTYLPPENFKLVLNGLDEAWQQQREQVEQQAEEVAATVQRVSETKQHSAQISVQTSQQAVEQIMQGYDALQGGFSEAPKFPNEANLLLLLDHSQRHDDKAVLDAVETTLKAMAQGGIYDQIAGGFHRYSTDNEWLVPHFEKMLYNQAYLARVYLQAYQLTGNELYARVARQTLDYVLRDMTSPQGGFYSATDADSEGEEGTYFVWTVEQLHDVLNEGDAALAIDIYGVTEQGNFEGSNILHLPESLSDYAQLHVINYQDLLTQLDSINETLRQHREQRIAPLRDDKIITAWNAMMIKTLVLASEVLAESRYAEAAEKNAAFLLEKNHTSSGQLWRVHMAGSSSIPAAQEDYAYFSEALIALYDQNQNTHYLSLAEQLTNTMIDQFWDQQSGGFYMNQVSDVPMMARIKQVTDGAIPSGNSVALNVLILLSKRTADLMYQGKVTEMISAFADKVARSPAGYSYFLHAVNKESAGELQARRYAAHGAVSMRADVAQNGDNYQVVFSIKVQPGWHINSHQPLDKDLIATEVQLSDIISWRLDKVDYPKAVEKQLGFSQQTLALYENELQIVAQLSKWQAAVQKPISIGIKLQACSEQVCLAPETINFKLAK